jgi:hypothetical protein
MLEHTITLATIGITLRKKSIKLMGQTLKVGGVAVSSSSEEPSAMILELLLPGTSKEDACPNACECPSCQTEAAITSQNVRAVSELVLRGRSESLLLDSCTGEKAGFSVKLRNLETHVCDVATGHSFILAVARAATKALSR